MALAVFATIVWIVVMLVPIAVVVLAGWIWLRDVE